MSEISGFKDVGLGWVSGQMNIQRTFLVMTRSEEDIVD
jgi:hypothetical protein